MKIASKLLLALTAYSLSNAAERPVGTDKDMIKKHNSDMYLLDIGRQYTIYGTTVATTLGCLGVYHVIEANKEFLAKNPSYFTHAKQLGTSFIYGKKATERYPTLFDKNKLSSFKELLVTTTKPPARIAIGLWAGLAAWGCMKDIKKTWQCIHGWVSE